MVMDGTIKIVTQTKILPSTGNDTEIIVGVLTLIGVIISAFITNYTMVKTSRSNEQLKERWNQKNIDASLIASARIEWIQKVRDTNFRVNCPIFSSFEHS